MSFPPEIAERLAFYVYVLVDPRNEQVFYVGKGSGGRLLAHGFIALDPSPGEHAKARRIREIRAAGFEPREDVVRYGLAEEEAFLVEASLIDCLPGLTNKVRGQGIAEGRVPLAELVVQFGAQAFRGADAPALLIRLARWHDGPTDELPLRKGGGYRPGISAEELYDATRGAWKLSPASVNRRGIRHAVAVHNGVTRAVYVIDRWFRSPESKRAWFEGSQLTDGPILEAFVGPLGKRVAFGSGAQNPVTYYAPGHDIAPAAE